MNFYSHYLNIFVLRLLLGVGLLAVSGCRYKKPSADGDSSSVKIISNDEVTEIVPQVPSLSIIQTPRGQRKSGIRDLSAVMTDDRNKSAEKCSGALVRYKPLQDYKPLTPKLIEDRLFLVTAAHCVYRAADNDLNTVRVNVPSSNGQFDYLDIPANKFLLSPKYKELEQEIQLVKESRRHEIDAAKIAALELSQKAKLFRRSIYDLAVVPLENVDNYLADVDLSGFSFSSNFKGFILDPLKKMEDFYPSGANMTKAILNNISLLGRGKTGVTDRNSREPLPNETYHSPMIHIQTNEEMRLYLKSHWLMKRLYVTKDAPAATGLLFTGYALLAGDSGGPMIHPLTTSPDETSDSGFDAAHYNIMGIALSCQVTEINNRNGETHNCKDLEVIDVNNQFVANNFVDLRSPFSIGLFEAASSLSLGGHLTTDYNQNSFVASGEISAILGKPEIVAAIKSPDFYFSQTDSLYVMSDDDVAKVPVAQNGLTSFDSFVGDLKSCPSVSNYNSSGLEPVHITQLTEALYRPFLNLACTGVKLNFGENIRSVYPAHCSGESSVDLSDLDPLKDYSNIECVQDCNPRPPIDFTEPVARSHITNIGFASIDTEGNPIINFQRERDAECRFFDKVSSDQPLKVGFQTVPGNSGGLVFTLENGQIKPICLHVGSGNAINSCVSFSEIFLHPQP